MATFNDITQGMDVEALAAKRKRHLTLMTALGIFGGGLYGYTLTFLSGALVTMNFDGSGAPLSSWDQSIITAVMLAGCAIGSFLGGTLADRFGRRTMITLGAAVAVIGAITCALGVNIEMFSAGRFIVGFAVGVTSCVIPIFLGEMAPSDQRGRIVSVNTVMINVAQLLASVVNAALAVVADWHAMLWAGAIPTVLLLAVVLFIRDTPHYLVRHGLDTEAVRVLLETRSLDEAESTYRCMTKHTCEGHDAKGAQGFNTPWLRRVLFVGIGIAFVNQLVGANAINYFAPTMFSSTLGIDPSNSIIAMVPVMVVSAIAAVVGGLGFIDKVDRRVVLMTGLAGTVVFLAAVGVCYLFVDPADPSPVMSWVLIAMVMLYLVFVQGMVSPATWLLIAEVFPSSVRGKGVGYANVAVNIVNFVISLVFLPLLNTVGGSGTFFIFAAINVGSLIFVKTFVPETRGKSLEQIEDEARARVEGPADAPAAQAVAEPIEREAA